MYLSKSKYCLGVQCEKILWLDKYKSEEKEETKNDAVLDNGTEVGIYAQQLFGDYTVVNFNTNLSKMIDDTKEYLKQDNIILCEASLSYNNNFCSVDILKKDNDSYEIYEVKSSTEVKDIYLDDASYQYYVLKNLGLNVNKVSIIHINSNYVRHGEIELNKLFNIVDITDIAISKQEYIKNKIDELNEYMNNKEEVDKDIDLYCFYPYECPFFKYCSRHLPNNNVFNLRGMPIKSKMKYYHDGKYSYKDLLNEKINEKYKQQIEFEMNDLKPYINKDNIRKVLNDLSDKIYFLDFETYQLAIPPYDNIRPYEQIPFQYSLHILNNNNLEHKEFLSEDSIDPRRSLAERLVNDIPINSCTVAYNMSFEKMIIKALANIYPDLSEHLMNIYNNMKDLMIPFKDRDYYVKEMEGSYSIKYVLPALFPNDPSLDYHNLNLVHKGDEASNAFLSLSKLDRKEKEKLRYALLKYCELDTYAMVKIYDKLKEVTN